MKSTVVDESLSSFKPMYCSREYQASTRLTGPRIHKYMKIFPGMIWYILAGVMLHHIVAVLIIIHNIVIQLFDYKVTLNFLFSLNNGHSRVILDNTNLRRKNSISSNPRYLAPLPGNTKNQHVIYLFSWHICTLHFPICTILDLFQVCNTMCLSLDQPSCFLYLWRVI